MRSFFLILIHFLFVLESNSTEESEPCVEASPSSVSQQLTLALTREEAIKALHQELDPHKHNNIVRVLDHYAPGDYQVTLTLVDFYIAYKFLDQALDKAVRYLDQFIANHSSHSTYTTEQLQQLSSLLYRRAKIELDADYKDGSLSKAIRFLKVGMHFELQQGRFVGFKATNCINKLGLIYYQGITHPTGEIIKNPSKAYELFKIGAKWQDMVSVAMCAHLCLASTPADPIMAYDIVKDYVHDDNRCRLMAREAVEQEAFCYYPDPDSPHYPEQVVRLAKLYLQGKVLPKNQERVGYYVDLAVALELQSFHDISSLPNSTDSELGESRITFFGKYTNQDDVDSDGIDKDYSQKRKQLEDRILHGSLKLLPKYFENCLFGQYGKIEFSRPGDLLCMLNLNTLERAAYEKYLHDFYQSIEYLIFRKAYDKRPIEAMNHYKKTQAYKLWKSLSGR